MQASGLRRRAAVRRDEHLIDRESRSATDGARGTLIGPLILLSSSSSCRRCSSAPSSASSPSTTTSAASATGAAASAGSSIPGPTSRSGRFTEIRVLDGRPAFMTIEGQEVLTVRRRAAQGQPCGPLRRRRSGRGRHRRPGLPAGDVPRAPARAARGARGGHGRRGPRRPARRSGRPSSSGPRSTLARIGIELLSRRGPRPDGPGRAEAGLRRRRRRAQGGRGGASSGSAPRRPRSAASPTPAGWSRTTRACSSCGCSSSSAGRPATRCMLTMPDGQGRAATGARRRRRREAARRSRRATGARRTTGGPADRLGRSERDRAAGLTSGIIAA